MGIYIYTVFIGYLFDSDTKGLVQYDNREAAEAHRDHINATISKSNPLNASKSFVVASIVRSTFGGE